MHCGNEQPASGVNCLYLSENDLILLKGSSSISGDGDEAVNKYSEKQRREKRNFHLDLKAFSVKIRLNNKIGSNRSIAFGIIFRDFLFHIKM